MNQKAIEEYLKIERDLKRKFEELKYGKYVTHQATAEVFTPLIKPLKDINNKLSVSKTASVFPKEDAIDFKSRLFEQSTEGDSQYGIYVDYFGDLRIGCKDVEIIGDSLVISKDKTYTLTVGLWELLTKAKPKQYSENDLSHYSEIVRDTYTYKSNNNPNSAHVKANRGWKYKEIIKPILYKYNLLRYKNNDTSQYSGSGLKKITTNKPRNIEYVYWNTIDELLERLTVLYGEIKAGNTNINIRNEIVNIIQELKEI